MAHYKRALAAAGLDSHFGYTDAPWPILIALVVFLIMLIPFMINWPFADPDTQSRGANRQMLMEQLLQDSRQTAERPQTYVRQ
jgi:hypothetical protein